MISKTFRIAPMIVLASLTLSSAAWAATCATESLNGTYGFLHDGTDATGAPSTAAVSQITFDPGTGTFTGETKSSHGGVITTFSFAGTYAVSPNCTGTGTPTGGSPFSIVVTPTGFLALHLFSEGFAVKQGSGPCTNAGVKGRFGFEATGTLLATGAVAFIGELKLTVNPSGEGVIRGHVAISEDGTFVTFDPVAGSYKVGTDCKGRAVITPKGQSEMHFSFVVVDDGNKMLAVETDTDTVVSGTLVKNK